MPKRLHRATNIGLVTNIFLFIIKAVVGISSNSIAVISEAVNSLTDIISSIAIKIGIHISQQQPDDEHQFGHNAAQPVAAFIVAVFAFVVGIEVIKESIERIIYSKEIVINFWVFAVLIFTIFTKLVLRWYQLKINKIVSSPALKAASVDSLNDVLASSIALIGVGCSYFGYFYVDGIAGFFVAMFILRSGYEIAKENIDFLMGRSADETLIIRIKEEVMSVKGVKGFNDLRSYYVGDQFHIDIHVEVNKNLTTEESHDIATDVSDTLENIDKVHKVFVHVDPV